MSAVAISAELREWARRAQLCTARDDLAAGFLTGAVETIPAGARNRLPPRQSLWRHLERGMRRPQRSPDRQKSYERRHRLAWSGPLPGFLAGRMTVSDMAVARILANEHLRRKFCDMSLDEIAARAGVCRKTAKRTLKRFRGLAMVTIEERPVKGRKSLTNIVRIVSREWLCWLEKRPPARQSIGGHFGPPTNTNNKKVDEKSNDRSPETRSWASRNRWRAAYNELRSSLGHAPVPLTEEASQEAWRDALEILHRHNEGLER